MYSPCSTGYTSTTRLKGLTNPVLTDAGQGIIVQFFGALHVTPAGGQHLDNQVGWVTGREADRGLMLGNDPVSAVPTSKPSPLAATSDQFHHHLRIVRNPFPMPDRRRLRRPALRLPGEDAGIRVEERIRCEVALTSSTGHYLRTKKKKLRHMLKGL